MSDVNESRLITDCPHCLRRFDIVLLDNEHKCEVSAEDFYRMNSNAFINEYVRCPFCDKPFKIRRSLTND